MTYTVYCIWHTHIRMMLIENLPPQVAATFLTSSSTAQHNQERIFENRFHNIHLKNTWKAVHHEWCLGEKNVLSEAMKWGWHKIILTHEYTRPQLCCILKPRPCTICRKLIPSVKFWTILPGHGLPQWIQYVVFLFSMNGTLLPQLTVLTMALVLLVSTKIRYKMLIEIPK